MGLFSDAKNQLENEVAAEDLFDGTEEIDASDIDADLLQSILEEENATEVSEPAPEPVKETKTNVPDVAEKVSKSQEADPNQVTLITKGTTINGSIISDCSLDVMGTINGDIECLGKLTISGNVKGNSRAAEIFVNTERLEGSLTCEGTVKVAQGTVLIGDVRAGAAVFAGAVKGEIDVTGPVIIDSTSVVVGNIKAKTLRMNEGGVHEGSTSFAYSDFDIKKIFE